MRPWCWPSPPAWRPGCSPRSSPNGWASCADVTGVEIAGPGFINLRLADSYWQSRIADVLAAGTDYGSSKVGAGRRVNVEYVSANPTGPLHIAHARGAVYGDALALLLTKAGFEVTREYYINDAGAQVDTLARSTHLRYLEALGETIDAIPEGFYPGDYLKDVGQALAARDGDKWRGAPESEWLAPVRRFAIDMIMAGIREDLALLGIEQEVFSSERAMIDAGGVERALKTLEDRGLIYVGIAGAAQGQGARGLGAAAPELCSVPPSSATMSTGRSRSPTAAGPISPATSPITTTSSGAARLT